MCDAIDDHAAVRTIVLRGGMYVRHLVDTTMSDVLNCQMTLTALASRIQNIEIKGCHQVRENHCISRVPIPSSLSYMNSAKARKFMRYLRPDRTAIRYVNLRIHCRSVQYR